MWAKYFEMEDLWLKINDEKTFGSEVMYTLMSDVEMVADMLEAQNMSEEVAKFMAWMTELGI